MSVRACQKCGCTNEEGCPGEAGQPACHWVGPTHCSACFPEVDMNGLCEEHMPSHPGVAAHFAKITPEICPICRMAPKDLMPGLEATL